MYPALAAVHALDSVTEILWVGSETGLEKGLVQQADIPFKGISAAGLRGKNPIAMLTGLARLGKGYVQSKRLLAEFKPDVLFVTGGYVCAPVTIAAHRMGIPVLIYLPDIQPGQAIKFLSRYATRIAVTAPPAQAFFPAGLAVVTGYPVRNELYTADRQSARQRLNPEADCPTILVFGGSQGARSINQAVTQPDTLATLLARAQLIHISGTPDADRMQAIRNGLSAEQQARYHLYPYLHAEMPDAFAAADLIISRAGASILGEAPAVGVPSILVPYPYSGAHQWPNAQYMADQGAAVIVADADLPQKLRDTVVDLLDDTQERASMALAARKLAKPDAAQAIAEQLSQISGFKSQGSS